MWFARRTTDVAPPPTPRDVEALEAVLAALDGEVGDELEVNSTIARTLLERLGFAFAGVWLPDGRGDFVLRAAHGPLADAVRPVPVRDRSSELVRAGGMEKVARSIIELPAHDSTPVATQRSQAFAQAGAAFGALMPMTHDGKTTAVIEFRCSKPLPFFGGREDKWAAIARVAGYLSQAALAKAAMKETLDDREAVTTVVSTLNQASSFETVLRSALETVRSAFGWAYGSFWALDEEAGVLRFALESGTAGEEFRRVTLAASFAEGVGLSGRAWRTRDLFFTADIGEMTDCVRAPAAQRAGVKSGVCFPLIINEKVIGTMDFFATETLELSASRESALRQVQQLVIQRLDVLQRTDADTASARELLDTVDRLRETSEDAARVGEGAVTKASAVTTEVESLSAASAAIGGILKVISSIAEQTNLLALNATIEAARAGEVGKGFAVVAGEVKELARATADATDQVSQRIADIQASSASVAAGIHETSEMIGRLDAVQSRMSEVLEEQAHMALAFSSR